MPIVSSPGYAGGKMDNIIAELEERDILSRMCERALLAGFRRRGETPREVEAHLDELEGLVGSLGIPAARRCVVSLREVHPRFLAGRGKVEEIGELIADEDIDLVVFDYDLSPAQQRNLEAEWRVAVIDRREVILDIFADRANSREAVLQTALARMHYSLPRLTRAWTHLSRQRGGARGNRGKGETQLETDRRLVLDKIAGIRRELARVHRGREVRRRRRLERPVPSVSLVGYTNAGKSSLLNALSGAAVQVENRLFATLDPTTRRVRTAGGREFLLTDTVGFIRKLPHDLIEAFHSTLEEALGADVILHVVDAGSPELDEQAEVTEGVLRELGAGGKPRILVLNKIDVTAPGELEALLARYPGAVGVSARRLRGLDGLLERLGEELDSARQMVTLRIPPDRWDLRSMLHRESTVLDEEYDEAGMRIRVRLNEKERGRISEYVVET